MRPALMKNRYRFIEVMGSIGAGRSCFILDKINALSLSHDAIQNEHTTNSLRIAWLYSHHLKKPYIGKSNILFIRAERSIDFVWSALQSIRSTLFDVLVMDPAEPLGDVALQRIQKCATEHHATVFYTHDFEHKASQLTNASYFRTHPEPKKHFNVNTQNDIQQHASNLLSYYATQAHWVFTERYVIYNFRAICLKQTQNLNTLLEHDYKSHTEKLIQKALILKTEPPSNVFLHNAS